MLVLGVSKCPSMNYAVSILVAISNCSGIVVGEKNFFRYTDSTVDSLDTPGCGGKYLYLRSNAGV